MRNINQILNGNQTILGEFFYRSTTPPALVKKFCDTNADARSVCGSRPYCSDVVVHRIFADMLVEADDDATGASWLGGRSPPLRRRERPPVISERR